MMQFRLTYALDNEEIIMIELECDDNTFDSMTAKAITYISENHGEDATEKVVGISLLRL